MRFVEIKELKEGMVAGQEIYIKRGRNTVLLASKGKPLTSDLIDSLQDAKITKMLTDDPRSQGIYPAYPFSTEVEHDLRLKFDQFISGIDPKKETKIPYDLRAQINAAVEQISCTGAHLLFDAPSPDSILRIHSIDVMILSVAIGKRRGFSPDKLNDIGLAALFHDVGMIQIDKEIVNKNSSLFSEEAEKIKEHVKIGWRILRDNVKVSGDICYVAYRHHERWDGSGYPDGQMGEKVKDIARIVAIGDYYSGPISEGMNSTMYRRKDIIEEILKGGAFDPEFVEIFEKIIIPYPVCSIVRLNNGKEGIVMELNKDFFRPKIKVLDKQDESKDSVLDLSQHQDIYIEECNI
ncbi:MAG: HD domain-containing phosphohydrolase [bacterium]